MNEIWLIIITAGVFFIANFLLYQLDRKSRIVLRTVLVAGILALTWLTYKGDHAGVRAILTVICLVPLVNEITRGGDPTTDDPKE